MLHSAEQAISAFNGDTSEDPATASGSASFEIHSDEYFKAVQGISARLKRQAYALEEAGIIAADPTIADSQQPSQARATTGTRLAPAVTQAKAEPTTNGGLGSLDIGWLNSRRDDVGKRKEAELWAEARPRAEKLESKKSANGAGSGAEDMELDEK